MNNLSVSYTHLDVYKRQDEGRLVVFLRPGGLLDTGEKGRVLVDGAQRQTHGRCV